MWFLSNRGDCFWAVSAGLQTTAHSSQAQLMPPVFLLLGAVYGQEAWRPELSGPRLKRQDLFPSFAHPHLLWLPPFLHHVPCCCLNVPRQQASTAPPTAVLTSAVDVVTGKPRPAKKCYLTITLISQQENVGWKKLVVVNVKGLGPDPDWQREKKAHRKKREGRHTQVQSEILRGPFPQFTEGTLDSGAFSRYVEFPVICSLVFSLPTYLLGHQVTSYLMVWSPVFLRHFLGFFKAFSCYFEVSFCMVCSFFGQKKS